MPSKAAIVEVVVGKGRVILSGAHCEFDPELFDPLDPYLLPNQKELFAKNQDRLALMAHLLNRLNIETASFLRKGTTYGQPVKNRSLRYPVGKPGVGPGVL